MLTDGFLRVKVATITIDMLNHLDQSMTFGLCTLKTSWELMVGWLVELVENYNLSQDGDNNITVL